MAFTTIFRSNSVFAATALFNMGRAALKAQTKVIQKEAIRRTKDGVFAGSGFGPAKTPNTGELSKNIFIDIKPDKEASPSITNIVKGLEAFIGTPIKHGFFWEKGHFNIFLNRHIRIKWLKASFDSTKGRQNKAALKAARKEWDKFSRRAFGRAVGLTGISPFRSTVGR